MCAVTSVLFFLMVKKLTQTLRVLMNIKEKCSDENNYICLYIIYIF